VHARDKGTGREQRITIQASSGLSKTEIDRRVKDAESHADDDRRMKDLAEAKNTAEQVAYSTEKSLKEHEDRLDEETRSDIRSKIDSVRQALDGDDAGEIRSRLEALREASFKLGEVVYQQAQQAQQSGPSGDGAAEGSEPAGDEEIVDAEVVDESGDRA